MTPKAEQRLRSHVRSIVDAASLPPAVADDLTEEMLGHLTDRAGALIADGATEDDAVRTAMTEFGGVAAIGGELGRTYHSRLWASTIGVLLTAREGIPMAPGAVGALRLLIVVETLLWAALGAVALLTATPVHAVVGAAASAVFVGAAVLAHRGLRAGQAWALTFAIGLAFLTFAAGLAEMSHVAAGTTTISLTAIAAAVTLVWLARSWAQVRQFVAGSQPIGRRLGALLGAALIGPTLAAAALPALVDPTQASPSDVDMTLAMTCGRRDQQVPDGPLLHDRQYADLSVDLFWRQSDLLPQGLAGVVQSSGVGDTAGFRIIEPIPIDIENGGAMPSWMLDRPDPRVTVAETGEVAGWFGSTSPSVALIPDTMGSFTVGIEPERIQSHRTIRIGWSLAPTEDGLQPWPRAEIAYAHLDRFVLIGSVGCGETSSGSAKATPAAAQERFLP